MTEFERMVQLLGQAYRVRDEIVICLTGPVGIAKTAAVRKHAELMGNKNVVTIIASQILPSEVSGITMPDEETKSMEIYDHFKLGHMKDGDILFFDELLEADQSVLSACLTLIESRMMMSGKLLPDIQIIAATNPTISPNTLKENIRQRFMFAQFHIDRYGTCEYIKDKYGFTVPDEVLDKLQETSSDYNILSPRSLTKLCGWIANTPHNELESLASTIDVMWNSLIGSQLVRAYSQELKTPEEQVRDKVMSLLPDSVEDKQVFQECTFSEMLEMLQSLPEWDEISTALQNTEVEEPIVNIGF